MSITAPHHNSLSIPPERETIVVFKDDGDKLYCDEFGLVSPFDPKIHWAHRNKGFRICVHRLAPPENIMVFSTEWVSQLHWQPKLLRVTGTYVIASRKHDVVKIAFDVIGPIKGCMHVPVKPENRWEYLLYRMRWWDQNDVCANLLLGVVQ